MADQWYKFGHGFLLVYSITDRPTFDALYGFHQDVLRVKDRPYVPCVVASNKVCPPTLPLYHSQVHKSASPPLPRLVLSHHSVLPHNSLPISQTWIARLTSLLSVIWRDFAKSVSLKGGIWPNQSRRHLSNVQLLTV